MFGLELCWFRWWIYRRSLYTALNPAISLFRCCDLHASLFFPLPYISLSTKLLHRIAFSACFAANTWKAQNFPFLSQALFFENGTIYDQLAILDSNFRLDPAKLAEVVCYFFIYFILEYIYWQVAKGLPWFPSSAIIAYIGANMAIGATVTHVLLWYGKDIIEIIRKYRVSFFSLEGTTGSDDWLERSFFLKTLRRVKTTILI